MRYSIIGLYGLVALSLSVSSLVAENIVPEPGFEINGITEDAHTGERCGYLAAGETTVGWSSMRVHHLPVEPYATYRATAYVKAMIGTGQAFALYLHSYNSFSWAFFRNVPLQTTNVWTEVSVTFSVPSANVNVYPLVLVGAANTEAWIDDVTVEKILDPAATMANLIAKTNPTDEERQLLARYYLARDDREAARALMDGAGKNTRADIGCLLTDGVTGETELKPLINDMLACGVLDLPGGIQRFSKLLEKLPANARLEVCKDALAQSPRNKAVINLCVSVVGTFLPEMDAGMNCRETDVLLSKLEAVLDVIQAPPPVAVADEVGALRNRVRTAREALDKRLASLGSCIIRIGGVDVTPATHAITIPSAATPQEKHAAGELCRYIELITGQEIPVMSETEIGGRTPIIVGRCSLIENLGETIDFEHLGDEGIVIRTVGPALILAGNLRGVLYASYTFLESALGCRWYTPDCETWPTSGLITVPETRVEYVPPLEYRSISCLATQDINWLVRNKLNGSRSLDEKRGGGRTYLTNGHTIFDLVPPGRYAADHPEYYSEINGKRKAPLQTQLCLTNPDVLQIATDAIRNQMRNHPDVTYFAVTQFDTGFACQCTNCSALATLEESESGPLLHFVNAIADAVRDEFPDKVISTLAYQYTRKPPKFVKPRPNVVVEISNIECCRAHPMGACTERNTGFFRNDLAGWHRLSSRLFIWDYVTNFGGIPVPFPTIHTFGPNINTFITNGVTGIFEQGGGSNRREGLTELRSYMIAKALWYPSADLTGIRNEFVTAYYGKAAPFINQYIDTIQASVINAGEKHFGTYIGPSSWYLTPEVLSESERLFDQAEAAVEDDAAILHRVQVARLSIMSVRIYWEQGYRETAAALEPIATPKTLDMMNKCREIVSADALHGSTGEEVFGKWLAKVSVDTTPLPLVCLSNSLLRIKVIPERGGRIFSMQCLNNPREVLFHATASPADDAGIVPESSGYKEGTDYTYGTPSTHESYRVVAQDERSVTLEATLSNHLLFKRRIELDNERAVVRISSSITNVGKSARDVQMHVQPWFRRPPQETYSIWMRQTDGQWKEQQVGNGLGLWLGKERKPSGAWVLVNDSDDYAVLNRFDPEQVITACIYAHGDQVDLDLFAPVHLLKPGESFTFSHSYEVVTPADGWRTAMKRREK